MDAPRRIAGAVREAGAKLLAAGGVPSRPTILRGGYAGEVVVSGRRLPVLAVVDDAGGVVASRCPCGERSAPGSVCRHVAALVLSILDGEGVPRHVRLAASPFTRAARSFHESGAAPLHALCRVSSGLELRTEARGRAVRVALAEGDLVREPLQLLLAAYPAELPGLPRSGARGGLATRLTALRRLVTTPEETALEVMGARTLARTWEDSFWHAFAVALFELLDGIAPRLAWRDGELLLEARREGSLEVAASLPPLCMEELLADEALVAASGFRRSPVELRPCVRVDAAEDGGLLLEPALCGADGRAVARTELAGRTFGRHVFLPGDGLLATVGRGAPAFADPAGRQAQLALDDTYRPSPFGVSLERRTVVPEAAAAAFLARHREEIARLPEALVDPALRGVVAISGPLPVRLTLARAGDGSVEVSAALELPGGALVPADELRRARREGRAHLRRGRSWIAVGEPSLAWVDGLPATKGRGRAAARMSALELLRLHRMIPGRVVVEGDAPSIALLARVESARGDSEPPAEALAALFPFQASGVGWLWFLRGEGFGGLLCDDMGLGKTHQAIALMRAHALSGAPLRALVICPASVVPHWGDKLAALMPGATVRLHVGARRGRPEPDAGPATVVVTSYATARNDAEILGATPFDLLVLDEIQTIKNRGTATHQAIASLRRRMAIGLTGTPVENSAGDLEALLRVVVPGYLPAHDEFERIYLDPVDAGDPAARARLARLVSPFLLRRTKAQVLPDLPRKIVDRRACELTPLQRELYGKALGRAAELRRALAGEGAVPYIHVFALMSRLKQICNHPSLVGHDVPPGESASGKWDLFCELLDEATGSGHKVVVFSQYVRMLAIVEAHLESRGLAFASIKGATRDRRAPVERFRTDPDCRVFTASLRAAGLGLDLTAASVVIMYDRWWNQAWEDQAVDRVHRIGQTRGVQVVKLVTRDTIEERIEALIERKAELADDLVREDAPTLAKRFSREELQALLAE